ncbi:hypothetical protein D920_01009 [Enterococcus faecalis 13-SD-W-01]|jgi:uncharacterized protein YxeA|nr:hypothetical protein D920_01009 [Enterococcus faecalis 13-SD-W-01]
MGNLIERGTDMKKILVVLAIIVVGFLGYKSYKYYDETYNGVTAYAKVPMEIPKKEKYSFDDGSNPDNWDKYTYELTLITKDGKKYEKSYDLAGNNPTPFVPGSYVQAEVSKKRFTKGPSQIEESKVPKEVLKELNK